VNGPIIELDGVTATYRDRLALRDVSLSIAPGERIALIGPNGAGKSTLLAVVTGLLRPAAGSVRLFGTHVAEMDRLAVARRLAVVPGVAGLPFATRVEEVIALGRIPHEDPLRGPRPSDKAAVAAAIERVGVGHLLGRDARELSLGERQLVLISMAVAQATPVLILDEPTVHLDLRHQVGAMELLADLNERDGTTIVAVPRSRPGQPLLSAAHPARRWRIVADGALSDVLTADRIRDVFVVDPGFVRLGA
jgi:iron complex transport system ATP-binding protein